MDYYSKNSVSNLAVVAAMFAGFLYLCISWSPSASILFFPTQNCQCPSTKLSETIMTGPKDELEMVLERASMVNKTVIIVMVNKAYADGGSPGKTMLDLFLEGFWVGDETRGLVDHILLVAMDQIAFDRCKFMKLHCYKLETEGVDFGGEKFYMSREFIKMMWRRTLFLGDVLKRGYSFIFTDMDVMWLRNPFVRLSGNQTDDLQISCDEFNGYPESKDNLINTGFYFVRSNNKTIALFDSWYDMKDSSPGMKEQDVLIKMMHLGMFEQLGLRVRFLDTLYFSGFCRDSRDFNAVTTVHANCCRSMKAKVVDLMAVLRDWTKYKRVTMKYKRLAGNSTFFKWSPHSACFKSWIGFNFSAPVP
ncbi:uncharacterized protein At1g28695-like isoform X1 [Telopea speciosissima]|uniref:uncharacterized protein At1g28695-like isoform X1 n=2 Tax=Telopea speciosissima TaxID=54955 RepID=UPI001CC4FD93|nr:uncharacterized protein At1g28695-like isoform X1 [Telopea speciosissima]